MVWVVVIVWRLSVLQVLSGDRYTSDVNRISKITINEIPRRGKIYDRNGHILAMSISVPSICAYPPFIEDTERAASLIGPILNVPVDKLRAKMEAPRQFVWLARQVDSSLGDAVFHLGLKGIGIRYEFRRVYPYGALAGKVLGTVGVDQQGLAGLEYGWDSHLGGQVGERILLKDARRNDLDLNILVKEPRQGEDLHLSIDTIVQYFAEREARRGAEETMCDSIAISIMNPQSGEVLAHAVYPSSDPSSPSGFFRGEGANWLSSGVYEPGSTLKPFIACLAFEDECVGRDEYFSGNGGRVVCAGRTIRDHKVFEELTFAEALIQSSNVVFAQVGMRLEPGILADGLRRLGFGRKTGIDLPGEEEGILHATPTWQEATPAYMALGQEIAVTNAQLLRAYTALATDGVAVTPHFNRFLEAKREKILSGAILREVRPLLHHVTAPDGTGHNAWIAWSTVAGKTGTAQKPTLGKGYEPGKVIASFVGWLPYDSPRYLLLVMVNEPKGRTYGSEVAAPIFSRLATSLCVAEEIRET